MTAQEYIFVYGTLRQDIEGSVGQQLLQYTEYIGKGTILGKLFDVGRYPGMILSGNSGYQVTGEVYLMKNPDLTLGILDRYEDYEQASTSTQEYKRVIADIMLFNDERISAWIYLYNHPVCNLIQIHSGDYSKYINAK